MFRYVVEVIDGEKIDSVGQTRYSLDAIVMAKNHIDKHVPHLTVRVMDVEVGKEIGYAYLKKDQSIGWRV